MNNGMNSTNMNRNSMNPVQARPLTPAQLENAAGGKKSSEAIVDLIAWAMCGFNHHYVDTGKTKKVLDGPIPTTFKQVRCKDCGHKPWVRVGVGW